MFRALVRRVLAALPFLLASCGPDDHPGPPTENTIANFRRAAGVTFAECGTLVYEAGSRRCPEGYADSVSCMLGALDPCVPAHLLVERFTPRGSATVDHLFVLPEGGRCGVWAFLDERDANDCPFYARKECDGLTADQTQCASVAATGCGDPVSLGRGDCRDAE